MSELTYADIKELSSVLTDFVGIIGIFQALSC